MKAAKKEKYFKNTIFIFVGDHGLRGDAGDLFPKSFTKQGILAEHVPLLFYSPNLLHPKKVRKVCSQLDVLPSVAALARQSHRNTTLGRNLFDTTKREQKFAFIADPDLSNIALVSDQYYFSKGINGNTVNFVSVINNESVAINKQTDSIKTKMDK